MHNGKKYLNSLASKDSLSEQRQEKELVGVWSFASTFRSKGYFMHRLKRHEQFLVMSVKVLATAVMKRLRDSER